MKRWLLTDLVAAAESELQKMGYTRKAIYQYRTLGFTPIKRYYESIGKKVYSEETTWECVVKARLEVENGTMYDAKRMKIRKTATILAEYATNGFITWRKLGGRNAKLLTEPYSTYLGNYVRKLVESGYQATTIRGQKPIIKHFFHYLEDSAITDTLKVTRQDVLAYMPIISKKYARIADVLSILRPFLSFMYAENLFNTDFAPLLVVSVARRRKYYHGFTRHEVNGILSAVDRGTPCGKRDYAILMLAVHTGLRAIDVLTLKFGDIDWKAHELCIVQHKTEKQLTLPLGVSACNAIADYILNARPNSDVPYIFLRTRKPYTKLESWSGHAIVKSAAAKAGFTWSAEDHKGFHSFRRSLGSWMLEAEVPLSTISEVLGHAKIDSSKPYIMTHHSKLALCALPLQELETMRRELL